MTADCAHPYDVAQPARGPFAAPARSSSPSAVGSFPATRHSVVAGISSADQQTRRVALVALVSAFWRPGYKYVLIKWRADRYDAEDLTQEFFARALEKGSLWRFDPERARFRTFLRV